MYSENYTLHSVSNDLVSNDIVSNKSDAQCYICTYLIYFHYIYTVHLFLCTWIIEEVRGSSVL